MKVAAFFHSPLGPIQIPMSHKIPLVVFCAFFLTLITLTATSSEFHLRESASTEIKLNDEKAKGPQQQQQKSQQQNQHQQQQQQLKQPSVAAIVAVESQGQRHEKEPPKQLRQQQQQVQQQLSSHPVLPLVVTGQLTSSTTMDIIKSAITLDDGNKSKSLTSGENELSPVKRMDNLMEEDFPLTALHSFYHRKVPTGPLTPSPSSPLPPPPPPPQAKRPQQPVASGSRSTLSSSPSHFSPLSPVNSLNSVPSVASSSPSLLLFDPSMNNGLTPPDINNNGMSSGSTVDVTKYTHPRGHFTLSDHRSEKYHRYHHSGHLNNDQVKGDTLDQMAGSSSGASSSGPSSNSGGIFSPTSSAAATMALDHHQSQPLAITDYNELKGKHGYFPPSMYKDFIHSAHQRTLNTLYGHIDDKGFFVPAANVASHLTPSAKSTMTTITTPGIQSSPFDPSYLPPLQGGGRGGGGGGGGGGTSPSFASSSPSPGSPLSSLSTAAFSASSSPASTPSSSTIQVTSNNSPSSKGQIRSVLIGETLASALNREQKQQQQLMQQQQQQQQSQQQQQGHQEASSSSANERIGYFGPHPMMFGGYLPPYHAHSHHSLPHYPVYPFMSPIHSMFHNTLPHHQLEQLTMPYMSPPYMMPPAYFGPMSPLYGPYLHRSLTESPTSPSSTSSLSPLTSTSSGSHSSHQIPVGSSSLMHLPGGVYSASASSKSPSIHPHASYTGPMVVANSSPANFTLNSPSSLSSSSPSSSSPSLLLPPVEATSAGGTSIMSPIHHFNLNDKEHKLQSRDNSNSGSNQSSASSTLQTSLVPSSVSSSSPLQSSSSSLASAPSSSLKSSHGPKSPISPSLTVNQVLSQKKFFFPGPSNQL